MADDQSHPNSRNRIGHTLGPHSRWLGVLICPDGVWCLCGDRTDKTADTVPPSTWIPSPWLMQTFQSCKYVAPVTQVKLLKPNLSTKPWNHSYPPNLWSPKNIYVLNLSYSFLLGLAKQRHSQIDHNAHNHDISLTCNCNSLSLTVAVNLILWNLIVSANACYKHVDMRVQTKFFHLMLQGNYVYHSMSLCLITSNCVSKLWIMNHESLRITIQK